MGKKRAVTAYYKKDDRGNVQEGVHGVRRRRTQRRIKSIFGEGGLRDAVYYVRW